MQDKLINLSHPSTGLEDLIRHRENDAPPLASRLRRYTRPGEMFRENASASLGL